MNVLLVLAYGAAGGAVRGLLAMYGHIERWRDRRNDHRRKGLHDPRETFAECADWGPELITTGAQIALGAIAAYLLYASATIQTVLGLILAGVSAPAILYQLGQVKSVQNAVISTTESKQSPIESDTEDGSSTTPFDGEAGSDTPGNRGRAETIQRGTGEEEV